MTTSVLGPHCILPTADALVWARAAPVVKSLDRPATLAVAPAGALRIFRRYWSVGDQDAILTARDADRVVDDLLAALAGYRHANLYVEVLNEVGKGRRDDYLALLALVVPRLHAAGLKVAGPSWSTGDYEQADWDAFRAARWCGLDAIALHAYWGAQGFTPYHALRYRTYWRPGQGDPSFLVISECGRDRVEGGKGGWKADGLAPAVYLGELAAYALTIAQEPRGLVVATPFTAGPTPDWTNFDTDPLSAPLAATAGPPPTVPQEQPVTTPGIDVSNHNGVISWPRVAASGVRFAGMKASGDEGIGNVYVDPTFPDNWHQSRANGLVRIAYHYARPSAVSPAASVTTFQRAIQAVGGLHVGDLVALDMEDPGVPDGVSLHVWTAEWLALAEDVFGVRPVKYSAHYYTSTHDLEHDDLERFPTWWASYQASIPPSATGWDIDVWQNSASGTCPGVTGQVDTDLFLGTVEELRLLGLQAPAVVDWETPVFGPIYRGASAVGGMPDKTVEDERTAQEIIRLMDVLKAAHG